MKKLMLLIISIFVITTSYSNPIIDALNTMHKISNKYWKHQREILIYILLSGIKKGFQEPSLEQDPNSLAQKKRGDLPQFRIGGAIEGIGELADIATLTLSNPKLIRLANILAATSRISDVALGSFPELPRCYLNANENTCDVSYAVSNEKPLLRFWPAAWQNYLGEKKIKISPLYLAALTLTKHAKHLILIALLIAINMQNY